MSAAISPNTVNQDMTAISNSTFGGEKMRGRTKTRGAPTRLPCLPVEVMCLRSLPAWQGGSSYCRPALGALAQFTREAATTAANTTMRARINGNERGRPLKYPRAV
jgi:hypothetical protein